MGVAAVLSVLGLAAVLTAIAVERPRPPAPPGPPRPAWDPLPTPAQVRAVRFPLAPVGYDRRTVDVHLAWIRGAYEDLLAEADDGTVARARARAEDREPAREPSA